VNDKETESNLEKIINDMDLPFNRKTYLNSTKLRWLQKNMCVRNKDHPHFNTALTLIQKLLDNG
jgi:hypothetical protein